MVDSERKTEKFSRPQMLSITEDLLRAKIARGGEEWKIKEWNYLLRTAEIVTPSEAPNIVALGTKIAVVYSGDSKESHFLLGSPADVKWNSPGLGDCWVSSESLFGTAVLGKGLGELSNTLHLVVK